MVDFEILTNRFIAGTLDAEGAEELRAILKADPDKQRVLAMHVILDEELCQHACPEPWTYFPPPMKSAEPTVDFDALVRRAAELPTAPHQPKKLPVISSAVPRNLQWSTPPILIPMMTVALVALIIWSAYLSIFPPDKGQIIEIVQKPQIPAVVTDVADVQWKGVAPKLGEPLMPGELAFESGTVELLFFNGVRSVIEGPADLTLLSESKVFCNSGRWSVTVPPSGIGFEIQTPQGTVRDLGTQFFADVNAEKCDLHVLKGSVEFKDTAGKTTLFKVNQAGTSRVADALVRMATEPKYFVTKTEMRKRSDEYLQQNPPPDVKTEPILSVDFSQETLSGATLFSGRREDGAFHFTDSESRIRLPSLGKRSAFTVLLDIRVDQLNIINNPILMSEGSTSGGLVWNILPGGEIGFSCRSAKMKRTFSTPTVFVNDHTIGQWMQLGLSFDGKRNQMSVYLNGDVISTAKLPGSGFVDLSALDIGNWKLKSNVRQLDGAVKSITVFDRVLDLREIRNSL